MYTYVAAGANFSFKPVGNAFRSEWIDFSTQSCLTPNDFGGYVIIKSATATAGRGIGGITINWCSGPAKGTSAGGIDWVTGLDLGSVSALHGAMIKR